MARNKRKLSVEELKYYLHYDPITGEFTNAPRTVGSKTITSQKSRVSIDAKGYKSINVAGAYEKAAVLAWLYMTGKYPPEGYVVDHKSTIPSDNSWENLRLATPAQNAMNASIRPNHSTGVKGVYAFNLGSGRTRYTASLVHNRKQVFSKNFDTLEEAAAAIKEVREKYHGEFANHG
jgi:hypothetical protein